MIVDRLVDMGKLNSYIHFCFNPLVWVRHARLSSKTVSDSELSDLLGPVYWPAVHSDKTDMVPDEKGMAIGFP